MPRPISYNYGVNVTCPGWQRDGRRSECRNDRRSSASKPPTWPQTGTAAETSDTDQWLPVGVFAMVRNEQQHPQLIVQLAINKQGILRGNYTDEVTDNTLPIHGAVDKQTQRAAWTVGDNKQTVMEAGLSDLTRRRSAGADPQERQDRPLAPCPLLNNPRAWTVTEASPGLPIGVHSREWGPCSSLHPTAQVQAHGL